MVLLGWADSWGDGGVARGDGFVFEVFGATQGEGAHSKAGYVLCGCAGDGCGGGRLRGREVVWRCGRGVGGRVRWGDEGGV